MNKICTKRTVFSIKYANTIATWKYRNLCLQVSDSEHFIEMEMAFKHVPGICDEASALKHVTTQHLIAFKI